MRYAQWVHQVKEVLFTQTGDVPDDFELDFDWFEQYTESIPPVKAVERYLMRAKRQEE